MRRTTVRIDDALLAEAKAYAARHGRSLNSVLEDALRQMLTRQQTAGERPYVELPVSGGGGLSDRWDPSMDISHIAAEIRAQDALEEMEERERDAAR